ncbi:MAG TPA: MBL fold metallo-hydrolase [Acidimicrobiales bacterium]|nr:MBL fold metallo-hydrolase [Acidimicrobiales bacterium]
MTVRIDLVRTAGVFSLDGEDFDVENNVWLVGDDDEVVVIDAAHDAAPILAGVGRRRVRMVVCTHGHNDHVNVAADLASATGAPVALHGADRMLWDVIHPHRAPDVDLAGLPAVEVAGTRLEVLPTPGHSPGGVCLHLAGEGVVFSGDTLFEGGPGATGRSFSDRPTLLASICSQLLPLPAPTVVHTGHGPSTTIGREAPGIEREAAGG